SENDVRLQAKLDSKNPTGLPVGVVRINKYFEDEEIKQNGLFYICSMIERVARKLHQRNRYVVNAIGYENLYHLISLANVLHSENPDKVACDWIKEYSLEEGTFDIMDVDQELCTIIPTPFDMGKVYTRLIVDTALTSEDYVSGMIRVYDDKICETIDFYTNGAFYEPSYVIARAYKEGEF
ncbi:hypothetical protein, partial [uncultured Catenibacterium sp.]